MMAEHHAFDIHLTGDMAGPSHANEANDDAFTIVVCGSFSGEARTPDRGARRKMSVDRDDVDVVLAAIAPRISVLLMPGEPAVDIGFSCLDDFHPDSLIERVPLLRELRALRDGAAAPPREAPPSPRSSSVGRAAALQMGSGSLLDRIVDAGSAPAEPDSSLRGIAPADELGEFVKRAVRGHTVADLRPHQLEQQAKVDAVLTAMQRVLLHAPAFQSLESLWRGVDFLVRRVDTGERLAITLLDLTKEEFVGATAERFGTACSLVLAAYSFEPEELAVLQSISGRAARMQAPVIAGASPRFAGTASFAGNGDSDDWDATEPDGWSGARAWPSAPFLSLSLPRFLLRLPYGEDSDPCERQQFEELEPAAAPDHAYLWGNPAFACAVAIADGVAGDGSPSTQGTIGGLPLHVFRVGGEPEATPCTEAVLPQRTVAHLLDRGLTPLTTSRDGDEIRLARIQSIAQPATPLRFRGRP
jgi:type VI secretion system protein ImpC